MILYGFFSVFLIGFLVAFLVCFFGLTSLGLLGIILFFGGFLSKSKERCWFCFVCFLRRCVFCCFFGFELFGLLVF